MIHATGLIAEYNPFHNGHLWHLQEAKRITAQPVIVVMSASFMQRGEPACLGKWQRAALAVANGADLVLELPTVFSLRSAQYFAAGAVRLLEATGCVNSLVCGVETPDLDFPALARYISSDEAQAALRAYLAQGYGYASACSLLIEKRKDAINRATAQTRSEALRMPNDILALEYCKALLKSELQTYFIKRTDAGYNSDALAGRLASASAIRHALRDANNDAWQQAVPTNVRKALLDSQAGYDEKLYWQLLSYRLRLLSPAKIAERCQCSEGLENLLKRAAAATTLQEALQVCTNKRYSTGRCRRLLAQLLLDLPRAYWEQDAPAYLRVLAFNDAGRRLLKQMRATATLPLITKLSKQLERADTGSALKAQLEAELRATELWSLLQYNPLLKRTGNDFLISPTYVK
jgi:predicted nucleotidyltransferase